MRAVLQRVSRARVTVEERTVGHIAHGLMIFLGVGAADTSSTAASMADKIANLRFIAAARPEQAKILYEEFCSALANLNIPVQTGIFQATMSVELVNEGPVTILLDSDKTF